MQKNSKKPLKELSVFFPCYNEEENIIPLLDSAFKVFPQYVESLELIVINDGSTDKTSEIARKYAKRYPSIIRVVDQENSGGYGGAVKTGFREVTKEWVFFTDADLQFDLREFNKFADQVSENIDLIIGFRKKRAEGFRRQFLATGMKVWSKVFFGYPMFIKDTDCAFKLIRKEVIDRVGKLHSNSNLVTTEFILKAYRKGYTFKQIGVNHYCRVAGESKCGGFSAVTHVVKDTFQLFNVFYAMPLRSFISSVVINIKSQIGEVPVVIETRPKSLDK